AGHEGEVHLLVPPAWKKVAIPYLGNSLEPINDPEAKNLRMEFLRQELIALDRPIPILVFYPERYSETVNPDTYRLAISGPVQRIRGIPHLNLPLYLKNVSRLFVEVIKDQLTLTVIAAPRKEKELLDWTLHVINPKALEDAYVKRFSGAREGTLPKQEEQHIRRRFNTYLRAMELYQAENQPLDLRISLQGANIQVQAPIMEQQTQPAAPPAATKE
ncbi:MAG: hypothetical protein KDK78_12110, partial [Chlamydiia bacterium]|nr:hypothetical protein [Chlamydiia bacterium]